MHKKARSTNGKRPTGSSQSGVENEMNHTNGTNVMNNSIALVIDSTSVRKFGEMYSLNDLHRASGGEKRHQPGNWLANQQAKDLTAEIEKDGNPSIYRKQGLGTFVCKELVIAYAAWISAAFHLKVIRLFLATMRPINPAIDYERISPAQAQDIQEIVAAIVKAGIQGYGETWRRLHNKFRVNSYLELPATRHVEVRKYLIAKLPNGYAPEVIEDERDPLLTSASYRRTAHSVAVEFADACRDGVKSGAVPQWDKAREREIADGVCAAALTANMWLLHFDHDGRAQMTTVPKTSYIVDPKDPENVANFVRHIIGYELLPKIFEAMTARVQDSYKLRHAA